MSDQLNNDRLKAFSYLTAEKARTYRAVMQVFTAAKARFALHLRPVEIVGVLRQSITPPCGGVEAEIELDNIESALNQLCEWGNLSSHPDTTDVATVEEFYRPRHLFQITREGEAAEQALATYQKSLRETGELQAAALADIRDLLGELATFAAGDEIDEAKAYRTLDQLRSRFAELTSQAQTFIGSLQRTIDLHEKDLEAFCSYKEALIEYLERFIGELVIATADIAGSLLSLDPVRLDRLLCIAARRELVDAVAPTDADRAEATERWRARWQGLCHWFIRQPNGSSQAEILRARALSAIPALLSAVAGINERRFNRSDRSTDLRTLARWFAEIDSDNEAHRLWRAAFALTPARHLRIDQDTLDERETVPVSSQESWLSAPPLHIAPRLRKSGRYTRRGAPNHVIDCAEAKAQLAHMAKLEAEQIEAARRELCTGHGTTLSEIGRLNPASFQLFLDLLGQALAARGSEIRQVDTTSSDGAVHITLTPIRNAGRATILTQDGDFCGLDHHVMIRELFAPSAKLDAPDAVRVADRVDAIAS